MPKTILGKWSVSLLGLFFLSIIALQLLVISGQSGPGFNPLLAAALVPAGLSGISAFITGIVSIIKSHERAVFVFISTAIGFLVLFFVFGEFLFPH